MSEKIGVWLQDRNLDAERRFVERHGHVDEITVGTILEYDGWQWALVTALATDRDEPMIGFVLLDQVPDHHQRLEEADGCRQHYKAVEHLRDGDHEFWTPVEYVREDDIWSVLGPIHPEFRSTESDAEEVSDT
jgi:hypothetical protein